MGRRSTTSPYGSNDMLVDNRIGSAFPIVCAVERRLPEIIYLAQQSDTLQQWHDDILESGQVITDLAQQVADDAAAVAEDAALAAQGAEYVETVLPTIIDNTARAEAARESSELISQRISETTTMDFLNFEVNLDGDLLVHFAGYADASKFNINTSGELEVTL